MNSFLSKTILLIITALMAANIDANAMTWEPDDGLSDDTIYTSQPRRPSKYDQRIHRYRKHWQALIPTQSVIQFAGNMGLVSIGTGWDYGKRRQWETQVLLGFIPKCKSARAKLCLTVKENYIPWSRQIGPDFFFEPLETGIYFNTVFGKEFWSSQPSRYPKGYYKFATKIRPNIFVGQRMTKRLKGENWFGARAVTGFYEISTNDLYVFEKIHNSSIRLSDIICLSVGFKMQLL